MHIRDRHGKHDLHEPGPGSHRGLVSSQVLVKLVKSVKAPN